MTDHLLQRQQRSLGTNLLPCSLPRYQLLLSFCIPHLPSLQRVSCGADEDRALRWTGDRKHLYNIREVDAAAENFYFNQCFSFSLQKVSHPEWPDKGYFWSRERKLMNKCGLKGRPCSGSIWSAQLNTKPNRWGCSVTGHHPKVRGKLERRGRGQAECLMQCIHLHRTMHTTFAEQLPREQNSGINYKNRVRP